MHSIVHVLQYLVSTQYPHAKNGKRAKSHICGNFEIVRGWRGGEFERKEDHPRDTIQLTPTPFLFKYRRCLMGRQNL